MKRYEFDQHLNSPDSSEPPAPFAAEPTDKIVSDIMKTEREIAQEKMHVMRSRHERERAQWERLFQDKEQEALRLGKQLMEDGERLKKLEKQCEEDRLLQLEQVQQSARELEARRDAEKKKWAVIAEEVKTFRDAETKAQSKYIAEQEKAAKLKKTLVETERTLHEQLAAKDEELFQVKEQLVGKEELWLKTREQSEKEIADMQARLNSLQQELNGERQYQGKVIEKKDNETAKLQAALQDVIIHLNEERRKSADLEEKNIQQQQRVGELEDHLKQTVQQNEQDKQDWKKTWQEEQAQWEACRQEFKEREETRNRETDEQVHRIMKSVELLEQQLAEENRLRKELEAKLQQKGTEIKTLMVQKDELVAEWRKILDSEKESWQNRQSEITAEFERNRQAKDDELVNARKEMCALEAALSEEKKLFLLEKEENKQFQAKFQYLENSEQRLIEQLNLREKEWKDSLVKEQELFRKQIDDLTVNTAAQLKSRETEIGRLSEETKVMNAQVMELRQKLSQEKNESNNRFSRVQDLENQVKALTQRYNQENLEWENKYKSLQSQWESHRSKTDIFESDMENIYQKDIQVYRDKIKKLNARVTELQHKLDLNQSQVPPAAPGGHAPSVKTTDTAPASVAAAAKEKASGTGSLNVRVNNKFYPGK
jgi:DNA repair exonuclease SbcCD ATPase subunit